MILTKEELSSSSVPPILQDRDAAASTTSLFCWMAALWFFLSPWTYFGVSDQPNGWNAWIVGGLMIAASSIRVLHPRGTAVFSLLDSFLGVWVVLSPFVLGYTNNKARMINAITSGIIVFAFSIVSLRVSKDGSQRLATSDVP